MSYFYVGDRVLVFAQWSSFYRMNGTVEATKPRLMVRIDGDSYPIAMGERECIRIEESTQHIGGAE
jgi:hypothetical protein